MRLRACTFALAAVLPLRAFAQTPPPPPPPAAADVPPAAAMPPAEKPVVPQEPAATPPSPPAVMATPPAPVPPAPAVAPPAPKLTWGGLVDTYYLFNFTRNGANTLLPPGLAAPMGVVLPNRVFDNSSNSFELALAKVSLNAAMDVVSFQLDMGYGTDGTVINGGSAASGPSFLLEQAFGTITLPGNLTLDFGKFVTTAGAEVIEANKNWLYSRSFLFGIIPFVHTGVRANLKVNDQLTLQASLVNNWGGPSTPDNNGWKTIGLSASITASPMVSAVITAYLGKEAAQAATDNSTPGDLRVLIDAVGAFTINDKFGLNLNIDYIKAYDDVASDYMIGAALMGRYVISDHLYLSARGEFLSTHFTVPMIGSTHTTTVEEGTLMAGIPVGKNFELRPEIRADFANDAVYTNGKKNEFTAEAAALTYF
jgi:hypothetical protein